ncbi:hypothetical protein LXL04_006764 [Taraxacum kok-saghyz]
MLNKVEPWNLVIQAYCNSRVTLMPIPEIPKTVQKETVLDKVVSRSKAVKGKEPSTFVLQPMKPKQAPKSKRILRDAFNDETQSDLCIHQSIVSKPTTTPISTPIIRFIPRTYDRFDPTSTDNPKVTVEDDSSDYGEDADELDLDTSVAKPQSNVDFEQPPQLILAPIGIDDDVASDLDTDNRFVTEKEFQSHELKIEFVVESN